MSPARTKKPRVVKEPDAPVPAWLVAYEERAKALGYYVKRLSCDHGEKWWLSETVSEVGMQ